MQPMNTPLKKSNKAWNVWKKTSVKLPSAKKYSNLIKTAKYMKRIYPF